MQDKLDAQRAAKAAKVQGGAEATGGDQRAEPDQRDALSR
ncbi:MAG: hypothetical protein RL077_4610, partial [Verrucomicrobiota bacterium]